MMQYWRPYTDEKIAAPSIKVKRAYGSWLELEDSRKIFDGISSWWVITHGHSHPHIVESIKRQMEDLHQVVFANFTYDTAEKFAALFSEFVPLSLGHLFLSDNGSTAIEVALKMSLQYAQCCGFSQRTKFLAFERSYHGDTCGAMSVSGDTPFNEKYRHILFDVIRCRQGSSMSTKWRYWVVDFERKLDEYENRICGILIEPLTQGAGGMIVWPCKAVQYICQLAKKHKIPLIFDEVMTGFGRTGSMFAFQKLGVTPDFLCLSKGLTGGFLPMGVSLVDCEIHEAFIKSKPSQVFFHGHSFTGNALSCVAAMANLEVWSRESPLPQISMISQAHHQALNRLKNSCQIFGARVCGAIGAFEWSQSEKYNGDQSRRFAEKCLEKSLFLRPLGSTIYLMPPYSSTHSEIEEAWQIVEEVLRAM